MKLFQYWDTGEPPGDVAACIRSVRERNPEFTHRLFDRPNAAWFIGKHVGKQEQDAFLSLAVPAMQADYFRLCALWAKGGLWLDADMTSVIPLRTLITDAVGGYVSMVDRLLETDFLFVRDRHSPFYGACLDLATQRIEARTPGNAFEVTGPMVLNFVWAAIDPAGAHEDPSLRRRKIRPPPEALAAAARRPGAAEEFATYERRHDSWTFQWLSVALAHYKTTKSDWRQWTGPVYREPTSL